MGSPDFYRGTPPLQWQAVLLRPRFSLVPILLFEEHFKLCDDLKVAGSTNGPFNLDQASQRQTPARDTEQMKKNRVWQ